MSKSSLVFLRYFLAPPTHELRDVPWRGALSLLQKTLNYRGGLEKNATKDATLQGASMVECMGLSSG